jgi:hypothetical protein
MSRRRCVGVDEALDLADRPPDAEAGVGDVAQHGRAGGDLPPVLTVVRVPGRVRRGGARDALRIQLAHDRADGLPAEVCREDPPNYRRSGRVRYEPVLLLTFRGSSLLPVRSNGHESVAVRRSSTDVIRVAGLDRGLLLVPHALADHLALLPAQDAVHRQDEVVCSVQGHTVR